MKQNTERFSGRAENYVRYRPSYPNELIDCLYTDVGFSPESAVADIGSGTGIFSALLLERGTRVTGVEPNAEMRKAAEALLSRYPLFTSVRGTAEDTGLEDHTVDFVVCATAFHWFDRDACKKEFGRILKPGGKVVLVWNTRITKKDGFPAEYDRLLKDFSIDYDKADHRRLTHTDFTRFFRDGVYGKVTFGNEQILDFEGLRGRLLSSSHAPLPGELRHDEMMAELRRLFDRYQQDGTVSHRYETIGYIGAV